MPKAVAFIPARSGSKRIPHKNIRPLGGHPVMAYSIQAALDSGVFDAVVCVTDDPLYAEIAMHYGAEVPALRPAAISGDTSPDIEWVQWTLGLLAERGRQYEAFSILRPTSPFRKAETIRRAWEQFRAAPGADSIRAVEKCKQHPGKMWLVGNQFMTPLLPLRNGSVPWHSSQYAALPVVYVQNASLEIAWTRVATVDGSIAGEVFAPFITTEEEGLDVNDEFDWWRAERLLETRSASLPRVSVATFKRDE